MAKRPTVIAVNIETFANKHCSYRHRISESSRAADIGAAMHDTTVIGKKW